MALRDLHNLDLARMSGKTKYPDLQGGNDTSPPPKARNEVNEIVHPMPSRQPLPFQTQQEKNIEQLDHERLAVLLEENEKYKALVAKIRSVVATSEPQGAVPASEVLQQLCLMLDDDDDTRERSSEKGHAVDTSATETTPMDEDQSLAASAIGSSPGERHGTTSVASVATGESTEGYAITSVSTSTCTSETSSPPLKKKNKSQRRRTLAIYRGSNLLHKRESFSPPLFLASAPTDESYVPSGHSSPESSLPEKRSATQKKTLCGAEGCPTGKYASEKTHGEEDSNQPLDGTTPKSLQNTTEAVDVDASKPSGLAEGTPVCDTTVKLSSDKKSTASKPLHRRPLRRSQRRRTMALHKGSLLLVKSTPNSLSSVSPPSEHGTTDQTPDVKPFIGQSGTKTHPEKDVEVKRRAYDRANVSSLETNQRERNTSDAEGTPVQQTKKEKKKPTRRSRRNSIMPEKFREQDVIVGYKPRVSGRQEGDDDVVQTRAFASDVKSTPDDVRLGTIDVPKSSGRAESTAVPKNCTSGEQNRIASNATNEGDVFGDKEPTADTPNLDLGRHIAATENDGDGFAQLDLPLPKPRRKRRSSIGLHITGGLVSAQDIEHLAMETMSRKRSRRHQREVNNGDRSHISSSDSDPIVDTQSSDGGKGSEVEPTRETGFDGLHSGEKIADELNEGDPIAEESDHVIGRTPNHDESTSSDIVVRKAEESCKSIESQDVDGVKVDPYDSISMTVEAPATISASDIVDRIRILFPDGNAAVAETCVSSRVFSCFNLVTEKLHVAKSDEKAGYRTRRNRSFPHVQPLLPLLRLMVRAEMTSLGMTANEINSSQNRSQKRVHFCGIDYSSTKPPVDSVTGSHVPLEMNIHALHDVLVEVRNVCRKHTDKSDQVGGSDEVKVCLENLIQFLVDFESNSGKGLREACMQSMPCYWPPNRFKKASELYRGEFQRMLTSVSLDFPSGSRNYDLDLEKRLADFLGRSIRFYLRKFFNPVPLPLTTDRSGDTSVRSRIHEILEMTMEGAAGRDSAAADGSISSVFSVALRHVFEYFGAEPFLSENVLQVSNSAFLTSTASQRGVGTKRATVVISDTDLEEVLSDIHEVHRFVATARACRFLSELMNWPGVREEIEKVGGWTTVETFAKMIADFDLEQAFPDDAYFVLLRDVDTLVRKVENFWQVAEPTLVSCEKDLGLLWKRFRCGTQSKSVLARNPNIRTIAAELREGKSKYLFPSLSTPSDE